MGLNEPVWLGRPLPVRGVTMVTSVRDERPRVPDRPASWRLLPQSNHTSSSRAGTGSRLLPRCSQPVSTHTGGAPIPGPCVGGGDYNFATSANWLESFIGHKLFLLAIKLCIPLIQKTIIVLIVCKLLLFNRIV